MKAHELLSKPGAWTQNTLARDHDGNAVTVDSPHACSWCIAGAIMRCYPLIKTPTLIDKLKQELLPTWKESTLKQELLPTWKESTAFIIGPYNDDPNRTQEEVVELLKKLDI